MSSAEARRIDRRALDRLRARVQQDVDAGLEFGGVEGATAAIGYRGEVIWSEGFGAARDDTPILMLSLTKTVFESVLWVLFERGLSPDTPVVDIVPEFLGGTQPGITVGMVETHLGGFAFHGLDFPDAVSRDARRDAMRGWRLKRPAGFYQYHPVNGGWVLAEIVERLTGRDFREVLRDDILRPLGLAAPAGIRLGGDPGEFSDVLLHRNLMGGYTPDPTRRDPMAYGLDTVEGLALGTPGVAAVGTASAIVQLYQQYLTNADGLWQADILESARSVARVRMPDDAGRPALRSLSFVLAGEPRERYGERMFFGPVVSERAFGHQGQGGQIAWSDPETGVSFAYLTNTVVFPPGGTFHPRARELSSLAAGVLV